MWNVSQLQHENTCLFAYSMEQSLSWEAIQFSASLEIPPTFYGTWSFITGFTSTCHLSLPKVSVQVWVFLCEHFITRYVFTSCCSSPNPQAGGIPLVSCPRLLIQYIRSYPPHWRPFHLLQPEDAPCHGDRDPLITESMKIEWLCNGMLLHGYITLSR